MRLIILENESMVSDVVCGREAIYIGSREGCRIHLADRRVAAEQAVLVPENNGSWVLQQLDTASELSVNGAIVGDKVALKTGDEIRIQNFLIRAFPEHLESQAPRLEPSTSVAQLNRFAVSFLPPGSTVKKIDEALGIQPGQLHRVGQVNVALSSCVQVEDLMNIALRTLSETFAAQRVWIGIRRVNYGSMEYVEGRMLTGQSAELPESGEKLKPRVLDRAQFIVAPSISAEDRTSVLTGPLPGPEGTLGMLYLDSGDSGRHWDTHDLDFFIVLANLFAVQLDAIFREIAKTRAATIDGEVSVAHEIQARLTPRKLPQWEEQLQFGAFREPGRERTGDIYDVVKLANNLAALFVAHSTATGPMPSMLMAQSHAAFRVSCMHQTSPHVFMRSLNWLLYDGSKDRPLDCFMGAIDPVSGLLRYALAGRTGAYIIGQRGEERKLGAREAAPSLGMVKNANFALLEDEIDHDETLVLFTPGVTTARNRKGETFDEERFVNILCDGFGQLASQLLKEMLSDLRSFTEGGAQPDDITVLLAHRV